MASVAPVNAAIGDAATLEAVRPEVRRMLLQAPAFAKLKPAEQLEIANRTVKVSAYLANPDGGLTDVAGEPGVGLARAQADASEATRQRLAKAPGQVGKDFQAGAVKQGRAVRRAGEEGRFPEIRRWSDPERIPGDRRFLDSAD